MIKVVIRGVELHCETLEEALQVVDKVAPPDSKPSPPPPPAPPPGAQSGTQDSPTGTGTGTESKWTEPAKRVIAVLAAAGAEGVDVDRVAEVAGLRGSKGSTPLKLALIELLGVGDGALSRPRDADGKRRWVLRLKGVRAAAKLGLIQQG